MPKHDLRNLRLTQITAPVPFCWHIDAEVLWSVIRLDYVSCILTIVSTVLVGRRQWEGWLVAGVNSVLICIIAIKTSQFGFVPANLFCLFLYGINVRKWRAEPPADHDAQLSSARLRDA